MPPRIDNVLAASSLSKQDEETVKLLVREIAGCDYCVAAHSLLAKMTGLPAVRPLFIPARADVRGEAFRADGPLVRA